MNGSTELAEVLALPIGGVYHRWAIYHRGFYVYYC